MIIDSDGIGNATIFGNIVLLIILVVLYVVVSKPQIDACHKKVVLLSVLMEEINALILQY